MLGDESMSHDEDFKDSTGVGSIILA